MTRYLSSASNPTPSLRNMPGAFVHRHVGACSGEQATLLTAINHTTLVHPVDAVAAQGVRDPERLRLPPTLTETEAQSPVQLAR
jgi:hypothetical protein